MELVLNLVWAILAVAGLYGWAHCCPNANSSRRSQLVALAMLLLILFPVVSITDDLWAAHNPAETDICVRRHDLIVHSHTIVPEAATVPPNLFAGLPAAFAGYAPLLQPTFPRPHGLPHAPGFNRPPPVA